MKSDLKYLKSYFIIMVLNSTLHIKNSEMSKTLAHKSNQMNFNI